MRAIYSIGQGANGKRVRLTTNSDAEPRARVAIIGTGFYLSLPYTMAPVFTIGAVRFRRTSQTTVKALDPIPGDWTIDLSTDPDEIDDAPCRSVQQFLMDDSGEDATQLELPLAA